MQPPDLLLITWNRRGYLEKTLPHLLSNPEDFRLYCWDNASTDGAADLIRDLKDERVVVKHFSNENVRQREPSIWFLENAKGTLAGKVDDDILLPHGWLGRCAAPILADHAFGLMGCWIFMPSDWEEITHKPNIYERAGHQYLRVIKRAGQSFLARRDLMRKYLTPAGTGYGFPVDQSKLTFDGFINGYPLPIMMAHNMDDPRSEHCLLNRPGGMGEQAAQTMRARGFKTAEEYGEWIRQDARNLVSVPFEEQMRELRRLRDRSLWGRIRRRWQRVTGRDAVAAGATAAS